MIRNVEFSIHVSIAFALAVHFFGVAETLAENPRVLPEHKEIKSSVCAFAISHRGDFVMLAEDDGEIWKWELASNRIDYGPTPEGKVLKMLLAPDDQSLVYNDDSTVFKWDFRRRWRFESGAEDPIDLMAFVDKRTVIGFAYLDEGTELTWWDLDDRSIESSFGAATSASADLFAFSAAAKCLVTIPTPVLFERKKSVPRIWKIDKYDHHRIFDAESAALDGAHRIAFSPRGELFAAAWGNSRDIDKFGIDGPVYPKGNPVRIKLFNSKTWKEQGVIEVCEEGHVREFAFSSDGAYLAVSMRCTDLKERGMTKHRTFVDIYDVERCKRITSIAPPEKEQGKGRTVCAYLSFLPGKQTLLCIWEGRIVQLWDLSAHFQKQQGDE